ncbi:TMEM175 family protein [Chloroflexota bacterium]
MSPYQNSTTATEHTKRRLEALCDGVFAVAMTLLVLDLGIPLLSQSSLDTEILRHLTELWPKFLAYFLSFLTIALVWVNHEFVFRFLNRMNSKLIWLNISILIFSALIPFTTSLVGEYSQSKIAVLLWGINGLITMGLVIVMWTYARKKGYFHAGISYQNVKIRKIVDIVTLSLAVIGISTSFFLPIVGMLIFGVIIMFHVIATALGFHEYKSVLSTGGDT